MSKIQFEMKQVRNNKKGRPRLTDEQREKVKKLMSEKAKLKRKEAEEARRLAAEEEKKKYLPCPFCGSKNVNWIWQMEFIICEDCRTTGPQRDAEPTKEEAIKLWNMRAKNV